MSRNYCGTAKAHLRRTQNINNSLTFPYSTTFARPVTVHTHTLGDTRPTGARLTIAAVSSSPDRRPPCRSPRAPGRGAAITPHCSPRGARLFESQSNLSLPGNFRRWSIQGRSVDKNLEFLIHCTVFGVEVPFGLRNSLLFSGATELCVEIPRGFLACKPRSCRLWTQPRVTTATSSSSSMPWTESQLQDGRSSSALQWLGWVGVGSE